MSLVGFVQCQNGEIQQKIFVRFGGFVVWDFTFRGLGLYFLWIRSGICGLELIFWEKWWGNRQKVRNFTI